MERIIIHQDTPHNRTINTAVKVLKQDGIIIMPTDTLYGLVCDAYSKKAVEKIRELRNISHKKPLSIICQDISMVSKYAQIDNVLFRILKKFFPGPYTFILRATREVPKMLTNKQSEIGIRIPNCNVSLAVTRSLGNPIITTSAIQDEENNTASASDPDEIIERYQHGCSLLLDSGVLHGTPSSIIDLTQGFPRVVRSGAGDVSCFM